MAAIITSEYRPKSKHTQRVLASSLAHLAAHFRGWLARDMTRPALIDYVAARQDKGAAGGTIRLELAYLHRAMTLAEDQGRIARVPRFPTVAAAVRRVFIRDDELQAIVAELGPQHRGVVLAAHETGWRLKSELLTRQWKHVDFGPPAWRCECGKPEARDLCDCGMPRPGWLVLEKGEAKNREPRMFPLTVRLRGILTDQRSFVDGLEAAAPWPRSIAWVFPGTDGEPQAGIGVAWRAACSRAGIQDRHPHDLRRTAITRWDAMGLSESEGMAYSGHKTPSIYRQYRQTDSRTLRDGAQKIELSRAAQRPEKVERIRRRAGK